MINNHQTNGHGDGALAEVADQLYAELQVVTRRLRRIQVLVNGVVVLEDAEALWSRAGDICGQALSTVEAAVSAIPSVAVAREDPGTGAGMAPGGAAGCPKVAAPRRSFPMGTP